MHPAVLDGDALHFGHARNAGRLVAAESFGRRGEPVDAAREDRRILDGGHPSGCHVGTYRMARVAHENDVARTPGVIARAIADRPDVHLLRRLQNAREFGMEVRKGRDEVIARGGQRSFLVLPRRGGHRAHQVDLVPPAGHEIGEDVPVLSPPLGAIVDGTASDAAGREDRPLGDASGVARRFGPEQELADDGPEPVGADDDICRRCPAVGEGQMHVVRVLLETDEGMAEVEAARCQRRFQHLVQVCAVDIEEGRAETGLCTGIEIEPVRRLSRIPGAAYEGRRSNRRRNELRFEVEAAQHLDGVGAQDDARADPGKEGGLLVDRYGKAGALQEPRNRHAGEAGADDGNASIGRRHARPYRAATVSGGR